MDPTEWVSYFYLIMEAEPVSKTLCSLTKPETMENIKYMCQFRLEILTNLEVPSSYKWLTSGIAEAAFGLVCHSHIPRKMSVMFVQVYGK
jgi:hypothetical protein